MSVACTIERYLNRPDWLRGRNSGLGGSDAPCVLGMGRFRGAYPVATDKLTTAVDDEMDEMMEAGLRLEPVVATWFSDKTGIPEDENK